MKKVIYLFLSLIFSQGLQGVNLKTCLLAHNVHPNVMESVLKNLGRDDQAALVAVVEKETFWNWVEESKKFFDLEDDDQAKKAFYVCVNIALAAPRVFNYDVSSKDDLVASTLHQKIGEVARGYMLFDEESLEDPEKRMSVTKILDNEFKNIKTQGGLFYYASSKSASPEVRQAVKNLTTAHKIAHNQEALERMAQQSQELFDAAIKRSEEEQKRLRIASNTNRIQVLEERSDENPQHKISGLVDSIRSSRFTAFSLNQVGSAHTQELSPLDEPDLD